MLAMHAAVAALSLVFAVPGRAVQIRRSPAAGEDDVPEPCPYSFKKPACAFAEPQAPRDLTCGAEGSKVPKAATLNDEQANFLPLTNVHFHLGAEHKTESYFNNTDSAAYDSSPAAGEARPGFMCSMSGLTSQQLEPYDFEHCKGHMQVGKSYEVHYVHSSAGYAAGELEGADMERIDDGLGGAANGRGLLNPQIVVQAQVYQIVQGSDDIQDMLHGWTVMSHDNAVMYPGSTTGTSHDNEVCSPYFITWHVDTKCHWVSPRAFDRLCQQMKENYHMEEDLHPHGSRKLVDSAYVVESKYVRPLA